MRAGQLMYFNPCLNGTFVYDRMYTNLFVNEKRLNFVYKNKEKISFQKKQLFY